MSMMLGIGYSLYVLRTDRITPVGIENIRYHARLVGRSKADVVRLFADDATGILIEDDHADAKAEVLEVLAHAEEVTCEVVVQDVLEVKAAEAWVPGMVTTDVGGMNEKSLIFCLF